MAIDTPAPRPLSGDGLPEAPAPARPVVLDARDLR